MRCYYYPLFFTGKETEAQRGSPVVQGNSLITPGTLALSMRLGCLGCMSLGDIYIACKAPSSRPHTGSICWKNVHISDHLEFSIWEPDLHLLFYTVVQIYEESPFNQQYIWMNIWFEKEKCIHICVCVYRYIYIFFLNTWGYLSISVSIVYIFIYIYIFSPK